tara:strand:- start:972 stop:1958 length:987 start_codon:yes stop_codon:yes gene_type:complete
MNHIDEQVALGEQTDIIAPTLYSATNNTEEDTEMNVISRGVSRRSIASLVETRRVKSICEKINDFRPLGIDLISSYEQTTGKQISSVVPYGGMGNHYDFKIFHTDGTSYQCEEKGTERYNPNINHLTPPWENSVQFYNGPAKHFAIANKYLRLWYDINVNNTEIKERYNLPNIPSFDEWYEGGPNCMLDPTCGYSIVLKENYRNSHPQRSMNGTGRNNSNTDYRKKVNDRFIQEINDHDKTTLVKQVQEKYNHVMNEKHVWLQTTGDPDNDFSFKWYLQIQPLQIIDVKIQKKKDIEFIFKLEDNTHIKGIMRWGKGCGFSCFRMDLK